MEHLDFDAKIRLLEDRRRALCQLSKLKPSPTSRDPHLDDVLRDNERLVAELRSLRRDVDKYRQIVAERDQSNDGVGGRLAEAEATIRRLQAEAGNGSKMLAVERENRDLADQLERSREELDLARERLEQLADENRRREPKIEPGTRQALEQMRADLRAVRDDNRSLMRENVSLREALQTRTKSMVIDDICVEKPGASVAKADRSLSEVLAMADRYRQERNDALEQLARARAAPQLTNGETTDSPLRSSIRRPTAALHSTPITDKLHVNTTSPPPPPSYAAKPSYRSLSPRQPTCQIAAPRNGTAPSPRAKDTTPERYDGRNLTSKYDYLPHTTATPPKYEPRPRPADPPALTNGYLSEPNTTDDNSAPFQRQAKKVSYRDASSVENRRLVALRRHSGSIESTSTEGILSEAENEVFRTDRSRPVNGDASDEFRRRRDAPVGRSFRDSSGTTPSRSATAGQHARSASSTRPGYPEAPSDYRRSVSPSPIVTQHNRHRAPDIVEAIPSPRDHSNRPFAPRSPAEIQLRSIVKFSRQGGKISRGTVHYIGHLPGRNDCYLGVELETQDGKHDGTYNGERYFQCKPNKGVFVAFNKVVMVWPPPPQQL